MNPLAQVFHRKSATHAQILLDVTEGGETRGPKRPSAGLGKFLNDSFLKIRIADRMASTWELLFRRYASDRGRRTMLARARDQRQKKKGLGSQRNPLKRLEMDKEIQGNQSLFL
jgi:hypothetical protein